MGNPDRHRHRVRACSPVNARVECSSFGQSLPARLRVIYDLGAILIIAWFYSGDLAAPALASIGVLGLVMLNVGRVTRIAPYVATGVFIWVCVLKSGVHATMAGVAVGLAIPLAASTEPDNGPLARSSHQG